jgi:predicted hotdog family 3-hydroxylacyl-ACP dehydratase
MTTRELSAITLDDLLPHRDAMMLIDEIVEVDSSHALTSSLISASYPLVDEKGVQPLIMVELAAQTAGVCNGLDRIKTQGIDSNQMGWLVGVKRAHFYIEHIPLGSKVYTRSENSHNYENLREVSCVIHLDERLIGEITLQLFQA